MKENLNISKIDLINFVTVFNTVLIAEIPEEKELEKELQELLTYQSDLTVKDLADILCRNTRCSIIGESSFDTSENRRFMYVIITFERFPYYWFCFKETANGVKCTLSKELGDTFRNSFPFKQDS